MPMSDSLTLLYPNDNSAHYDIDYVTQKHMPGVQSRWRSHGLTSWRVTKYTPSPDGTPPPYAFSTTLSWDKQETLPTSFSGSEFKEMMDDVTGFCDKKPIILAGEAVGVGS
ncbi:hypothetical protein OQA88_5573 [Cercophora sp. LCS_1]